MIWILFSSSRPIYMTIQNAYIQLTRRPPDDFIELLIISKVCELITTWVQSLNATCDYRIWKKNSTIFIKHSYTGYIWLQLMMT